MPHLAFGTPRKLPKAEALSGRVGVLDIAFAGVGGKSGSFETVTLPFITALGERLRVWVDHHDHDEHVRYARDPRFVLATKAQHGACPEMIDQALVERVGPLDTIVCHTDFDGLASAAKWMRGGTESYPGCDDDARAIDTRLGTPSAGTGRSALARPTTACSASSSGTSPAGSPTPLCGSRSIAPRRSSCRSSVRRAAPRRAIAVCRRASRSST